MRQTAMLTIEEIEKQMRPKGRVYTFCRHSYYLLRKGLRYIFSDSFIRYLLTKRARAFFTEAELGGFSFAWILCYKKNKTS